MVLMENELEYEINENGERVLVRSLSANKRVPIRFRNTTSHRIEVLWRDYSGRRRRYGILSPGAHLDIDTFATHPWIFEDCVTRERFLINAKKVFYPPQNLPSGYRTTWNVTVSVRSLRHSALVYLAFVVRKPDVCDHVGLPRCLARELRSLVELRRARAEENNADR